MKTNRILVCCYLWFRDKLFCHFLVFWSTLFSIRIKTTLILQVPTLYGMPKFGKSLRHGNRVPTTNIQISRRHWDDLQLWSNRCRPCLVLFQKKIAKEYYEFEVLNEIYLENFLYRWVVNRETNLMMLINPWLINN